MMSLAHFIDTLYGFLFLIPSPNNILCIISSNSSFSECVRKLINPSFKTLLSTNDIINPRCPGYSTEGLCLYGTQTVALSDGGSYLFTDSKFKDCYNARYGGAIDQKNGHLTILRCLFDSCSCGTKGGGVSFQSSGLCKQEDNLYVGCSSSQYSGAFDSWDTSLNPHHTQKRCVYIRSTAERAYAHYCIEYSPEIKINSNVYICGRAKSNEYAGAVVNWHPQGETVYSNCLFVDGQAYNSGGLSFMSVKQYTSATYSIQFCFFVKNYGTDNSAREIYFNQYTSQKAKQELIVHSFSATPGSTVYLEHSDQEKNWLPLTNIYVDLPSVGTSNLETSSY